MKQIQNYVTGMLIVLLLVIGAVAYLQHGSITRLRSKNDTLNQNVESLLYGAKQYRTKDSLSAAKIAALELSLSDWKDTHEKDLQTIKSLNLKNRDLKDIVDTQSETIIRLSAELKDTVIWHDTIKVEGKYFTIGDEWYDFNGIVEGNTFTGDIAIRDSLLFVESVKYKRILFFKTKRIKSRTMDVVSRNPYTTILDVEFVTIAE